ncbi:MAG: type II toxin-antitoxin system RelE/ParE family toxin [Gammaproteobacteria bacterium]|nr:type II toxin-antitoxin system RelE/ParE family toxin [Gammaproteobacteria bacterium]
MRVLWTEAALGHLDAIFAYIDQSSPVYALRVVDRITQRSKQIAAFPYSGRKVPEFEVEQIREVFFSPYRIIYQIKAEQIEVLAVIHGAMNLASEKEK